MRVLLILTALVISVEGDCSINRNGTYTVNISETTTTGTDIYFLRDVIKNTQSNSFSIEISTDKDARFSVSVTGVVSLQGYVDYDIQPQYQLNITWYNDTMPSFVAVECLTLIVNIEDDPWWPPYFNDTCCLCPDDERTSNYPFFVQIVDRDGIPLQNKMSEQVVWSADLFYHDTTMPSKECTFTVYMDIERLVPLNYGDVIRCDVIEYDATVDVFHLETYLPDTIQGRLADFKWFEDRTDRKLLKLVMTPEFMYHSLKGASWVCNDPINPIIISEQHVEFIGCPDGKFGFNCQHDCICKNGATCHGLNGACACTPGWKGPACDILTVTVVMTPKHRVAAYREYLPITCTYYNVQPVDIQIYLNGSTDYRNYTNITYIDWYPRMYTTIYINVVSEKTAGVYECVVTDEHGVNYTDTSVITLSGCPTNYYGRYCDILCDCENDAVCDRTEGCVCSDEWFGPKCENAHSVEPTPAAHIISTSYYLFLLIPVFLVLILLFYLIQRRERSWRYRHFGSAEFNMIIKDFVKNWNFPNIDLNNWMLSHSQLNVAGPIIGSGEFGKVECASLQIESVSIQVAVKSVIPGNCRTACYRDFCNEAERLITLQEHNNIIKLYGFVTRGDPKYIVIEYAKHGDLKCYLHTLRNSVITVAIETRLVKIAMNVASALEYMETLRIVHRDLACRNILLTEDYIAKIGDFGLSRDVYESGEYSLLQGAEGQGPLPLRWMPPELLNRGIFEPKSDVWSFGVVMWEIASLGETPFQTLPVFVFSKMLDDGTRLHKPNNCTNKAYILMYKCWLKHIESRPSPSTLLEELEEFLSENEKIFTNIHPDALSHVVDESQV